MPTYLQRSDAWHEWRKAKIGSSQAAAIMGLNPYQTPNQVWKEIMEGSFRYTTKAMQEGIDLEDEARRWAELALGTIFFPTTKEMADYPYLIASLDGLSLDEKIILEIKVSSQRYEDAKNGIIPEMYRCQIQHQLMVMDLKVAYYEAYDRHMKQGVLIRVDRDEEFIKDMLSRETIFYHNYVKKNQPPPLEEDDHLNIVADQEQRDKISLYFNTINKLTELKDYEQTLKTDICSWGDDGNVLLVDEFEQPLLKATRVNREGAVDWEKLCEAHSISIEEIEKYRKPQIGYYKITLPKV